MKRKLSEILNRALGEAKRINNWPDFEMPKIEIDYTKNEKFGDYSSNVAMMLAKKIGKSPMEIAGMLSSVISNQLSENEDIEKVEVAPPGYLNFYLSKKYLQDLVLKINEEKDNFGSSKTNKEKVMIEYSQPNTHKEFHIGHLRNIFIGSTLVNVLKKNGNNVIAANYIGDTGTHIAKCLWGIEKFHSGENLDEIQNRAEFLGKVYTKASQAIEKNPDFENEFKELQKKFEQGDMNLVQLWKKTKQWSMEEFQSIYDELGIKFDVYFWESEEEIEGKKMLNDILKTKNIEKSQGAIVANLEEYNLGVLVLVRKDGSALYGLKDIPLAIKKFEKFGIEKSIYVIDLRQDLYFKQIFKILELMGFAKDMQHVGYEFVSLKGSEMMSSRKGNIVPAKFLMDEMIKKVKEKFPNTIAEKSIAYGALKFYMLKYASQSKIEYDLEESVRLDGATGPYVQYAHARIASILEKASESVISSQSSVISDNSELLVDEKELSLLKELNKFPELLEEISLSYEAHKLTHYSIKIAELFHSFYAECRVIDEENKELSNARLKLVNAVRIVLAETLRLMGVEAPERM